eukprot:2088081-Alexandrium_andersonii.AAC.1
MPDIASARLKLHNAVIGSFKLLEVAAADERGLCGPSARLRPQHRPAGHWPPTQSEPGGLQGR